MQLNLYDTEAHTSEPEPEPTRRTRQKRFRPESSLRDLRLKTRLKSCDIATLAGCHPSMITYIERYGKCCQKMGRAVCNAMLELRPDDCVDIYAWMFEMGWAPDVLKNAAPQYRRSVATLLASTPHE